jgi:CRP-like cAMP-binding protein
MAAGLYRFEASTQSRMNRLLIAYLATNLASVLTMVAYLLRDILWLRFLTILSCLAGIVFGYFVRGGPLWTYIGWNIVFTIINIVQIAILIRERSDVRFTEEEKELHETLFKKFAPFEFMKLMRIAEWRQVAPGEIVMTEGQQLEELLLIYNGLLAVEVNGEKKAELQDGHFIGEVSFVSGGSATATVRAIEPTRYIAWSRKEIDSLLNRNPTMHIAMQGMLSVDLSKKLTRRAPSFTAKLPVILTRNR